MNTAITAFAEDRVETWGDIHRHAKPNWIYRGQRQAVEPLRTSFERCCNRFGIAPELRPHVETELRREFRRAYQQFAVHVPAPEHTLEWLSLMQHHGAPTRLLDFTYSIYVASYFALEYAESESVVWAVNLRWALEASVANLKAAGKENTATLLDVFAEGDERIVNNLLFSNPNVRVACPLNPFRLNERLRIQKGVFLVPGTVVDPFIDNLSALSGFQDRSNVLRIVIPFEIRRDALRHLNDMNIDRRSLFPGLDGFATSLDVFHPILDNPHRLGFATGNSPD